MYIVIDRNAGEYRGIKSLSFAPEISVTGDTLPIGEFQADIITEDNISIGSWAMLYDDLDNLWAKYWVTYAEHVDRFTDRIIAQSPTVLLERKKAPAVMYSGANAVGVITSIFAEIGASSSLVIDGSFVNVTLSGFCPEQTLRERLQWILMVIGGYARMWFDDDISILPIDDTEELVPVDKVFWKPSITYRDYVTAVRVTSYSYDKREPQTKEKWVTDGTDTWVQNEQSFTLSNPDVPAAAPENVVEVDGLTLVNSSNVSGLASYLAKYYFKRIDVEFDAINNEEWEPGHKLIVPTDEFNCASGYLQSCQFAFGAQARARMVLAASEVKESAGLTIRYLYGTRQIGKARYLFPVGYEYEIENPYITWDMNMRRYVFRPTSESVTGTMPSTNQVVDVQYEIALEFYEGDLRVVSVDGVEVSTSGSETVIRTAVIS